MPSCTGYSLAAGRGVCDRRRADPGLIGEGGPLDADDEAAQKSSGDRLGGKGPADDRGERGREERDVGENHVEAGGHVEEAHRRHDLVGHRRDPADAADDHDPHEPDHHQAVRPGIRVEERNHGADLIESLLHLKRVAAAERATDAEHHEGHGEHPAEAGQAAGGEAF